MDTFLLLYFYPNNTIQTNKISVARFLQVNAVKADKIRQLIYTVIRT